MRGDDVPLRDLRSTVRVLGGDGARARRAARRRAPAPDPESDFAVGYARPSAMSCASTGRSRFELCRANLRHPTRPGNEASARRAAQARPEARGSGARPAAASSCFTLTAADSRATPVATGGGACLRRPRVATAVSGRLRLWLERGPSGFYLRDAATEEPVRWDDERIRVVPVAGVSFRPEALADAAFDPGRRLAARAGARERARPERPRNLERGAPVQVGYVPREVATELAGDEQAVSLWRVEGGLRVLIVPADAWIGRPGSILRPWRTSSSCRISARA